MADSIVDVAAAVVQRPDGAFLLAQRPAGKVYEGYWEFPGGKIEPGETPAAALKRELEEELGMTALSIYPWLTRVYEYSHAKVRLHFQRVVHWHGEPQSKEAQAFAWQSPGKLDVEPMLPANAVVLKALELPVQYAITNATALGEQAALERLESALRSGLKLVQVREKHFDPSRLERFAREVVSRCHQFGAIVLVNGDAALADATGADGVHLTAKRLMEATSRPDLPWCAASCHDRQEIEHAESLELDFVVLGPVKVTASHPDARPLGWQRFQSLAADVSIPVYALGGMRSTDLEAAWRNGAHGVAMLSGAWLDEPKPDQVPLSSEEDD
ncbi:MAG: Nudix family hydrolase [Betaproteobacteria bacterium]|nr:MAG: Nudix family hydrolase [Betaproteobacteria bacterium]